MAQTFPKTVRLALSSEFHRVKSAGRSTGGRFMVLGVYRPEGKAEGETASESNLPAPRRFGFITSRRVGGAVVRNRVRRRLREIARKHQQRLPENLWLVVIARYTASTARFDELEAEWLRLARKAGLLASKSPETNSPETNTSEP